MKKIISYKNEQYLVEDKDGKVSIYKWINNNYYSLTPEELKEFLAFIGAKEITDDPNASLKSEISSKIKSHEIKTNDDIEKSLSGLSDSDKETLRKDLSSELETFANTNVSKEELQGLCEKIKEELQKPRNNEFLILSFDVQNGLVYFHLVAVDIKTKESREIMTKTYEYNQSVIDNLITPTVMNIATLGDYTVNDYSVESNLIENNANYTLQRSNSCKLNLNNISLGYAQKLKDDVTKLAQKKQTIDENQPTEIKSEELTEDNSNLIIDPDSQKDLVSLNKETVMKRTRKKPGTPGFMSLAFILILIAIFSVGLFFLTKYIAMK